VSILSGAGSFLYKGSDDCLEQIFGPCAVPFSLEKETLLQEAMVAVIDWAFGIYVTLVSQVPLAPRIWMFVLLSEPDQA
jgi:hypothetical protein